MPKARSIPFDLKQEIRLIPCEICGVRELITVDHITPVANGGGCEPLNLQPLCWQCNKKKSNRLTNDQLREWFESRVEEHYARHDWMLAMLRLDPFDREGFDQWWHRRKEGGDAK